MILKKKQLAVKVGQACAAIAIAAASQTVWAQETARVEVTGSSIKRIAQEGALPVLTLTAEDIKKTGVTNATDLIQMLPSMQGFVPSASSVNGSGAGGTTAALHSLQSKYTLVLLDGQRMAGSTLGTTQGGGFAVNLQSIPLDAVESVEILTDGASALYGSDAIAGVVNFITKKNKTDGSVFFNYQAPQHPGGRNFSAGVTKGWGNLETDRFNVLVTLSHDHQDKLLASDRDVSRQGGYFPFTYGGVAYQMNQRTGNTSPGNLTFSVYPNAAPAAAAAAGAAASAANLLLPGSTAATAAAASAAASAASLAAATTTISRNPFYEANGNCGTPLAGVLIVSPTNTTCRFNYAATVQAVPSTKRDSGMVKGSFKINNDTTAWGQFVYSDTSIIAQFAPSAAPQGVNATTRLPTVWNTYVVPYLAANGLTSSNGRATLGFRTVPLGGRADDYQTKARHLGFGIDGLAMGWSYKATVTLSESKFTDLAAGGYTDNIKFAQLVAAGGLDPILGTGFNTLVPALINGAYLTGSKSTLDTYHFGAQHDLFQMGGGMSIASFAADYGNQRYRTSPSDLCQSDSGFSTQPAISNSPVGGCGGSVPFDAERANWGVSAEWLLPIAKGLEGSAAVRHDKYDKTHSRYVFSNNVDPITGLQNQLPDADLGNTFSSTTYKLSFRWTPTDNSLIRGAYGTGFKAPSITELAGPISFGGSTSGSYACPIPTSVNCLPGFAQYDLLAGANGLSGAAGLKPEKSKQWTIGARVDPLAGLSLGADLWHVEIKDQVLGSGIAENVAFGNPVQYRSLFVDGYIDPPGGFPTIGLLQLPVNGGVAHYKGIDWDFSYRTTTSLGKWSVNWVGTRMLTMDYTQSPGGAAQTSLGIFGPDQQVVLKTQMHISVGLQTGAFTNTLTANYKSGYKDEAYDPGAIYLRNANGTLGATVAFPGLDVPSYKTYDWQGKYEHSKTLTFTAGIKNLTDKEPPLSLQNEGSGNVQGYDPRYADAIGRVFYLTGNYKF